MEKDHLKTVEALSREAMWLSVFGVSAAAGFIGGLISKDWLLGGLGFLISIMCFVRIIMIRRVRRARLR
jgi:hypothetical protein